MNHAPATIAATPVEPTAPVLPEYGVPERALLGHPTGLFVLFLVEMWERFSYYGMRALLILYLTTSANPLLSHGNPGRGWSKVRAGDLYGWYTGMVYLLPILGGLIADKLIGTHRSMVIGSLTIALGHLVLALSGIGSLAHTDLGMSIFVLGLVLIVTGTGHFKPNVSVMVDKLYRPGERRRDAAFTIFYMGINLGAFIGPLICSALGENYSWHWGFGAAAVGMIAGLIVYLYAKPRYLSGIGDAPPGRANHAPLVAIGTIAIAVLVAAAFHFGILARIGAGWDAFIALSPKVIISGLILLIVAMAAWFAASQPREDRGPVAAILMFVLFNAVFWLAYEQGGSSLNLFAYNQTNRSVFGHEMPAGYFQSFPALLVIVLAPVFAMFWSKLGARNANPSQPIKLALGLALVGLGYLFMVWGASGSSAVKVGMFWLSATYFMHTLGELCMSPTGLSFLTGVAPVRSVSLLMGIWFLSNAVANKVGGQLAGQIDRIASGEVTLPWSHWFAPGALAPFFLVFVFLSLGACVIVLALTPLLKRMLAGRA